MPSSYLVCATHRSGSNLLCMGLWHSDLAGRPQEFLSPTREQPLATEHGLTDPQQSYAGYLSDAVAKRQTPNGVFGSKVMWKHLEHFRASLLADPAWATGGPSDPWALLQTVLPQPRCLWMRRRNTVRQAISLVKAKQTNIYNTMQLGEKAPAADPVYDFAAIDKERRRFANEDALWLQFFQDNQIPFRELFYEDFAKDYTHTIAHLLDWLEIDRPEPFVLRPPDYQPQSDATNRDWEARYRAEVGEDA